MFGVGKAWTTIWKLLVSDSGGVPLSVTFTETRLIFPASIAQGVQVNRPVESTVAPSGQETMSKARVWAGRSASAAANWTVRGVPSKTDWSTTEANTGAVFGVGNGAQ